MPRKPKRSADNDPAQDASAQSANGKANATEPKKKSRATLATAKKKKPAAAKKFATPAKEPTAGAPKSKVEPTDDEIRIRAYFIAERRHRLSLPGDSAHDWIEARRQLIEEAQR